MPTEADNVISHEEADNSNEKPAKKTEARRKKRMWAQGSQTDDKALSDGERHEQGCGMCSTKLNDIQGKLNKLLSVLPETQNLKIQVAKLKKEKEELKESQHKQKLKAWISKPNRGDAESNNWQDGQTGGIRTQSHQTRMLQQKK